MGTNPNRAIEVEQWEVTQAVGGGAKKVGRPGQASGSKSWGSRVAARTESGQGGVGGWHPEEAGE